MCPSETAPRIILQSAAMSMNALIYRLLLLISFVAYMAAIYIALHIIVAHFSRTPQSRLLWFFSVLTGPLTRPIGRLLPAGLTESQLRYVTLAVCVAIWLATRLLLAALGGSGERFQVLPCGFATAEIGLNCLQVVRARMGPVTIVNQGSGSYAKLARGIHDDRVRCAGQFMLSLPISFATSAHGSDQAGLHKSNTPTARWARRGEESGQVLGIGL